MKKRLSFKCIGIKFNENDNEREMVMKKKRNNKYEHEHVIKKLSDIEI